MIKSAFKYRCKLEQKYLFNSCSIDTCKNFSPVLESKCMLQERKETLNCDKGMTEHEIKFFKGYSDVKIAIKNRKQAFNNVYTLLILDKYIDFCKTLPKLEIDQSKLKNKKIKKLLRSYPLNLSAFKVDLSLLSHILSKSTYDSFSIKTGCKMCSGYDLLDLLKISPVAISEISEILSSQE